MAVKTKDGGPATAEEEIAPTAPAGDDAHDQAEQEPGGIQPERLLDLDAEDLLMEELGEEDEQDEQDDEGAGEEEAHEDESADDEDGAATEDEEAADDDDSDDEGEDGSDDASAEEVPKGMEGWPMPAVKRIQKQSEQIRQLTAKASEHVTLNPSAANPLASTKTAAEVDEMVGQAKQVRDWVNANPDGGTVELAGGATLEISPEDAAKKRAHAEAVIEAAAPRKEYHAKREKSKPWELAEKVVPGLFDDTTSAGKFRASILAEVPEMLNAPDHEIVIAAAALGYKQIVEEQQGIAQYVRIELDPKTGKPKRNQSAAKSGSANKNRTGKKPSKAPGDTRPPQRTKQAAGTDRLNSLVESAAATGDDEGLADLLAAELD